MRKHLFYLLLLGAAFTNAQVTPEIEWQKCLGSTETDQALSIAQTNDGGYIAFGLITEATGNVTTHYGGGDYWVAKLDVNGNLEWEKSYGGSSLDAGSSLSSVPFGKILPVATGGYVIGGSSNSIDGDVSENYGDDVWIVKINDIGDIEWEKNYGGEGIDDFRDLQETSDGGFIFTAQTTSFGGDVDSEYIALGSFTAAWVVKIDSDGNISWQNDFGGYDSFLTEFYTIQPTVDGGYIGIGISDGIGGDVPSGYGNLDFWIVKMDSNGIAQWTKSYGGTNQDIPHSIKQTDDGGYIVVGEVYSNDGDIQGNQGNQDVWVIKLDEQGDLLWQKTYGGTASESASEVQLTMDGYVIAGSTSSNNGDFPITEIGVNSVDNFLFKIDISGNIQWVKTMGGSQNEVLNSLELTSEGGFITLSITQSNDGNVSGNNGSYDFWVVKLSPDCIVPELNIDTVHTICAGEELILIADVEAELVNWYDAADAETPIFTGTNFELPALAETTSYWVEAANGVCKTGRTEIVITVNPLPILTIDETEIGICSDNEATLYAESPSNVIFWYANEDDTEYLYHGNLFVTEVLTEDTTYWVEAYNLTTGCRSERIEVTITVGEALSAPIADDTQEFIAGSTLADLIVEHTGTLTWYADAQLTQELPETTLIVAGTTYYVTQSGVGCESAATAILVDTFLGNGNLNQDKFAYYPNPVKDILNFKGNEVVKSVQVYDLSGKLILNQNSISISNINLSTLPKGTYVVKATTGKGMNTFKIVKN